MAYSSDSEGESRYRQGGRQHTDLVEVSDGEKRRGGVDLGLLQEYFENVRAPRTPRRLFPVFRSMGNKDVVMGDIREWCTEEGIPFTDDVGFRVFKRMYTELASKRGSLRSASGSGRDVGAGGGGGYRVGDRVEAKVKGWTKFYPGRVDKINRDGTLDLKFDDGDFKSRVDTSMVRSLERSRDDRRRSNGEAVSTTFLRGEKIEAKVKGWTKFYPGAVEKVNRDGTYELRFDDGDRKSNVEARFIRSMERSPSKSSSSFRVGDAVEAKVPGWTKYYPGEISRVRGDGTYDISFSDGDAKSKVKKLYIRARDGGGRSPGRDKGRSRSDGVNMDSDREENDPHRGRNRGSSTLRVGDKVEAKVPGWT